MDSNRWQRIKEIFGQAAALETSRREAFLLEACADDPALRAEIEGLLESSDEAGAFDRLAASVGSLLTMTREQVTARNRRVGPYRIVEEIGRGGMGAVYLAEREDVGLKVALKLVRGGLASPENIRRFLIERRILARLEHPHIARLLDAGVTEDESPYLVMEHVSGEPLTQYCDRLKLTVDERLDLFRQVCEAVHHAHGNMIVHRDLKPANIFVEEGGQVKLLDFGIAKLVESDHLEGDATLTGVLMMTPHYASPEQVRGEPVTSASDGYSLGVVLYELLTGRRPYQLKGRTLGEIERAISEAQPASPSLAVLRRDRDSNHEAEAITPEEVARLRSTTPAKLSDRLKGDLDSIVQKALEKDPRRRYASVGRLWTDLERHLASLPIEARPHTIGYRLRRFTRRNRSAVAAAGLVVAALVVGLALALWQAREARRERDRAEVELAKSQEITNFLLGLFQASDPAQARGDEITARELLENGVQRIGQLSDHPTVQAVMSDIVGRVYRGLGEYDKALPLLQQAVELQRRAQPTENPELARSLNSLGTLYLKQGKYEEAEACLREAVEIRKGLFGEMDIDVATSLNDLAVLYRQKGSPKEAETMYRQALAIYRRTLGDHDPRVATALSNLALARRSAGDDKEAELLYRESLQIYDAETSPNNPGRASVLHNLGTLFYSRRDYAAAEPILREALQVRQKVLGGEHPDVAGTMDILGLTLQRLERASESEGMLRHALEIRRKTLGEVHPDVASSLNSLGFVERRKGNYEEAERLYRAALRMRRKLFGSHHSIVATSLNNLALLLRAKGDLAGSEDCFRQALDIYREALGPEHPYVASILSNLAQLLRVKKDYRRAEKLAREALELRRKVLAEEHPAVADSLTDLGQILLESGQADEGLQYLQKAFPAISSRYPPGDEKRVSLQTARAAGLSKLARFEEAEKILLECHAILSDLADKKSEAADVAGRLADLYKQWGKAERAKLWRDRAEAP